MVRKLLATKFDIKEIKNDWNIILFLSFYCIIFYIFAGKYQTD